MFVYILYLREPIKSVVSYWLINHHNSTFLKSRAVDLHSFFADPDRAVIINADLAAF